MVEGEPVRISMCHCLACQFPADRARIGGRSIEYVRSSDEGEARSFYFCPECGGTVYYRLPDQPDLIAVPIGAFADPAFTAPTVSVYESRRHPWVSVPAAERDDF